MATIHPGWVFFFESCYLKQNFSKLSPPCVLNSHYEVCAKSCGQSCASLYAPVTCPAQCEEDCVCDEGFVLSGHDCVPIARCGCFYQGRYYPALTTFHPKCEERCQCQPGGNVVCEVLPCGPNEECKLVDGVQKCHPTGNATCSVVGGLYLSFDGLAYTFQGTCTYILTKLQEKNVNLEPITVTVENEAWANGEIIVPKLVHVEVFGVHLTLLRNIPGQVLVDGVFYYLPVNLLGGSLRIYQHGISVRIHTSFGFAVSYDLFYHVRVTLPNTYTDQMRGLCGNYNGQKEDDLQLPDGTVVSDVAVFGAAWKIPIPGISCVDGCSGSLCPVCAEGQQELFKQPGYCGLLTLPEGPFAACHAVLDPTEYLNNCIHELCIGGGDKAIACQSIQSYVTACQAAKVIIQPWRSLSFCPLTCPANSHYDICSNVCEVNCAGLTDHIQCPENCAEGCQCDDGFFFDGLECISLDKCGCFENNRYFPQGQSYLSADCKTRCVCEDRGSVTCFPHSCAAGEECGLRDEIRVCFPKEGHCKLMPGAQLSSFDGLSGDVPAPGTYLLTSLCDVSSQDWFRVVAGVASCPPEEIAAPTLLHVFFKDLFITVNGKNEVWVNGLPVPIPLNITSSITLNVAGNVVVLRSPQVQVTRSPAGGVVVTVQPALSGRVCGACGNFNHDQTDDLQNPNGVAVNNVPELLVSWTARDFTLCVN
uniref:IgGFc-binding protein-like n=1 Tax=Pogona vitticeps TaxID=103695 RepID=A0ABM5ESH0_9SAUR